MSMNVTGEIEIGEQEIHPALVQVRKSLRETTYTPHC